MQENACKITFSEKVKVFSQKYLMCALYMSTIKDPRNMFTKILFSKLVSTSTVLEDFLDIHGAKNNKNWFFYRELAATVRHLSLGGYAQKHLSNRLDFYDLDDTSTFRGEGVKTLDFITKSLQKLAPVILHEAERLEIQIPDGAFYEADFPGIMTGDTLSYDIDYVPEKLQSRNIVRLASQFLEISEHFDKINIFEPYDLEKIREIVPETVNEVEVRRWEMQVHNLQSYFDTYVVYGGFGITDTKLKRFRSYFSVIYRLLELMGRLLHFYERHLHEAGSKDIYRKVHSRLSVLVEPEELLDRTINYGLFFVCHFLGKGKTLVHEILNENIDRSSIKVGVPVTRGFHSRPCLLVAKIVQKYGGKVEMCVNGDTFDASSVLDLQWAGGKIQNEKITEVEFRGDSRALADIEILAGVNYGEDTMGKGIPLPPELKYLRN